MKNGTLRKIIMTPMGKLLPKHSPDEANARLTRLILHGRPFMAARFGAVEVKDIPDNAVAVGVPACVASLNGKEHLKYYIKHKQA